MHKLPITPAAGRRRISSVFLLAALLLLPWQTEVHGQVNEVGLFYGGSFYMGELNPSIPFLMTSPAVGLHYRHNRSEHRAYRLGVNFGKLEGNSDLPRVAGRAHELGLDFSTRILELSGQIEVNFLPYGLRAGQYRVSPFLFGGGAGFYLVDNDDWSGSLLFGLGVKFHIHRRLNASLDWGMRFAFTDHIDEYSRLDNLPSNSEISAWPFYDWYSFAGLTLTYSFRSRKRHPCDYAF